MEFLKNYFSKISPISPEAMELISTTVTLLTIPKKTLIVEQGKHNNYMYIIKSGLVKASSVDDGSEGCETTVSLWMENETFGDIMTYITGQKATKSYVALEDCVVYCFDIERFRALFATNHEVCNIGRLVVEDYIVRSKFEHYLQLKLSPKEKYDYIFKHRKSLINRVNGKDLASYLRITPETLSRIRKNN
jgi:CRP-like cAMP-binding protein